MTWYPTREYPQSWLFKKYEFCSYENEISLENCVQLGICRPKPMIISHIVQTFWRWLCPKEYPGNQRKVLWTLCILTKTILRYTIGKYENEFVCLLRFSRFTSQPTIMKFSTHVVRSIEKVFHAEGT